ncbi:MAG TPA: hypothetical protein VJH37_03930 [Candidatus Nanoarchaeia archaeon]|nr:hypothetical protein [Candidatus Nanoarchaeia archaeon]
MNIRRYTTLCALAATLTFSGCTSLQQSSTIRFQDNQLVQAMLIWAPKNKAERQRYARSIQAIPIDKLSETEQRLLAERYDSQTDKYTLNPAENYILKVYGRDPEKTTAQDIILLHRLAGAAAFGNAIKK